MPDFGCHILYVRGIRNPTWLLQYLQFLARLEPNGFSRWNGHFGARPRIPADPGFARLDVEDAEPSQLDAIAMSKSLLHALKNSFDRHLRFGLGDPGFVDDLVNNIQLNQHSLLRIQMRRSPFPGAKSQLHDKIRLIFLSSDPSMSLATIEQHHFRRVCSKYATGITIVTLLDSGGTPHGLTVNSFTSVSLSPPLVLFCLDRQTAILDHFLPDTRFAINVLHEEQKNLSTCFARSGYDRFKGVSWRPGETGAPVLPEVLATLECGVTQMVEAGDHIVVIGEALHANWREGQPLVYFNSSYQTLRSEG
jgi:4-hydroxyphenylacetate 3-hydroxylase, reductase component